MKKILAIILAMLMVISIAACGSDENGTGNVDNTAKNTAGNTDEPKTLRVGTMDATATFDPCVNADCALGMMLVYDTILQLNYDTQEIEPGVATQWEWLDDYTLKLTLRDDATFSNGDTLTGEDVLYSLSRFVYENSQFDTGYDNIDFDNCVVEGSTLTLVLYEPCADFLSLLANDLWACVVNKAYVEANPDAWWDAPVGTGAYTCTENVDGSHATYEIRDDYWGEAPDAETIVINNYSESTTMLADFQNGDLDIVLDVPETDYNTALSGGFGEGVQNRLFPTYDMMAVCFPEYMEEFDDIKVREAISLAIDVETMATAVFGSLGQAADSVLIDGVEYYESIGVHEYDPERAKELLAEAGYEGGMDLLLVIPNFPTNSKAAEILQAYLAEVGITLTVEAYDFATAIPILMANGTDISLFGTGGGTYLASSIFSTLGEGTTNGGCRVTDETFNSYINAAYTSLDSEARADLYAQAQQWAYDNYRTLPIAYSQAAALYASNISNLTGLVCRNVDLTQIVIG